MHVDSHFVIGHAHVVGGKPCQDYAASGLMGTDGAYAIVSDGCSSGGQTDIGSRLIAMANAKALKLMAPAHATSFDEVNAMVSAQQRLTFDLAINVLDVNADDLLATSIYAYAGGGKRFIHLQGDGVVAFRLANGTTELIRYDWADNTPSYPVYVRDDYAEFTAFHRRIQPEPSVTAQYVTLGADGQIMSDGYRTYSLEQFVRGVVLHFPSDTALAAIFTDGVTQVDGMDWQAAVLELLNFKTTAGEFAKRRLNRFVKDRHATGRGPIDDLAYAVIRLDPEDTP